MFVIELYMGGIVSERRRVSSPFRSPASHIPAGHSTNSARSRGSGSSLSRQASSDPSGHFPSGHWREHSWDICGRVARVQLYEMSKEATPRVISTERLDGPRARRAPNMEGRFTRESCALERTRIGGRFPSTP